ncbi:flavodoxin family protein [Salinibacillus xinjiangensis]|uniref:Flavodoxin family protein n=1 Tax=Salinibacillus xinjiangensis TaxID=1229268 RepID=A0A6G1X530_9BACI|nr:flavodoxin family protein [Salinibacillus xinjiangensis]MRG86047.1 flavodoxin family protein [Salinibacillus xinjiangensis]
MSIAVIYGGTRENGNTEILTEHAIKGFQVERIYLKDFNILPIEDLRHDQEGFKEVHDNYNSIIKRLLTHDTIIFSTPIYWFGMTGQMKNFIDRWSQTFRDSKFPNFKNQMSSKSAFLIAVGGDNPQIKGLPLIQQFQYIFDFAGISFEGYVLGEGNKPGEILNDKKALHFANKLLND